MGTVKFQMFKLDLDKTDKAEIKLPTSMGSSKKQESSRKTATSAVLTMPKSSDYVENNKLWKILQEMGIPDCLTCLLRNLHAGQEARARTGQGSIDSIKLGKEYKNLYCHPVYLTYLQSTS